MQSSPPGARLKPVLDVFSNTCSLCKHIRVCKINEYRTLMTVLFPSSVVPLSVLTVPLSPLQTNPMYTSNPKDTDEAESLMVTQQAYVSVTRKNEIEKSRSACFKPGFNQLFAL